MARTGAGSATFNRRTLLGGGAAAVAALALWSQIREGETAEINPLINFVCDSTIPDTDTPGALKAGVPFFLKLAVASGILSSEGDELERLPQELDKAAGDDFMSLDSHSRLATLTRHDAACFTSSEAATDKVWPLIKRLIVLGYYTSEIGASQELQYNLDPDGFRGDLPYHPGERAQSTDRRATSLAFYGAR